MKDHKHAAKVKGMSSRVCTNVRGLRLERIRGRCSATGDRAQAAFAIDTVNVEI